MLHSEILASYNFNIIYFFPWIGEQINIEIFVWQFSNTPTYVRVVG